MDPTPITVFLLVRTTPAWLRLTRHERRTVAQTALEKMTGDIRHFDAEAFYGRATDLIMWQSVDMLSYHADIERLRDTALFAEPYFEIVDVIPAIEDGFRLFEASEAAA